MSFPSIDLDLPAILRDFARSEDLPAAAAAIVDASGAARTAYVGSVERTGGPAVDGRTRFRIASMTKCFTVLATLGLRDAGRLRLDDEVARFVPAFASPGARAGDAPAVTVRDLFSHRAGLVTDDPWADRHLGLPEDGLTAMIAAGWPLAHPPRTRYEYSNLGYAVLGRVIAAASGQPFQAHLRQSLLGPLGMDDTGFDPVTGAGPLAIGYAREDGAWRVEPAEPDGSFSAMGGLISSVDDYAKFVRYLLSAWPPRDAPETGPLRRATVREIGIGLGFPEFVGDGPEGGSFTYGGGMLCVTDGTVGRFMTHSGGLPGYGSNVLLMPDAGIGVFGFASRTYAPMHRLTHQLASRIRQASPPPSVPVSDALADAVARVAESVASGSVAALGALAADNLLRDRSAGSRDKEIAALRERLGRLRLARIEPRHALAGRFVLAGPGGEVSGTIILTPEPRPRIQSLIFLPTV